MPSNLHEMLVELFVVRPEFAPEILGRVLGMALPRFDATGVASADATELSPTEYRADAVVTLSNGGQAVLAVVVEAQLRPDPVKRWTWPVYVATLRARSRCPAVLMVVCVDAVIAAWCAEPIALGNPGSTLLPLVLGPGQVPLVTDPDEAARTPELAVLSAIAHGARAERIDTLDALPAALAGLETDRARLYLDIVLQALPAAAQRHLEELMATGTYEYQSDFARKYYGQGKTEGRTEAVLDVLDARGIDVPADARSRITTCTDPELIGAWLRRVATAQSVAELFADPA